MKLALLRNGMPALTAAAGGFLAEGASVCLRECGHGVNSVLHIRGVQDFDEELERLRVTRRIRACHDDLQDATEHGACAIAILTVQKITDLPVVRRARKGTRFDYYLGTRSTFDFAARLEVSGILRESQTNRAETRLRQKLQQTRQSDADFGEYVYKWS